MTTLNWRIGVEIEVLAPRGKSRFDLAVEIAQMYGGSVHRCFHPQSEPSLVPGTPVFHNLTLGFEILNAHQQIIARCVDDLTLQADLSRDVPSQAGWYRIISDDERLLRLIQRQADPAQPLTHVLEPIGRLFGTTLQPGPEGMVGVNDETGASIAIAAPLPGERERPCELITAPLVSQHQAELDCLLSAVRALDFSVPLEGAIHLHFDATDFQSTQAIANLVQLLWHYGPILKQLMGTNPHCRRLGRWPATLLAEVSNPSFHVLPWPEAQRKLRQVELTKYCDFNLVNCIHNHPHKNTIEVRILPVWLDSQPIVEAAALFIALFQRALDPEGVPLTLSDPETPVDLKTLLAALPLSSTQYQYWLRYYQDSR
ncbi:amidoligase family protein [Acaryochloris sp. CCMEE 5410]|uniref:amidoligase family protein n=1 Tax=Acaryochloris sp. CCMEE 5410 TaxID=310037 RepID=UPI000248441C|nr:amidoligase family protein [Acaryochloris sp. CCMEE 5410]KAI9132571.1 amidoligase family protein [Acaryochloris sp. CCMEE 5410]